VSALQLPLLSEAGVKNGNRFIALHRQRGLEVT
jgi:hypothetical protein